MTLDIQLKKTIMVQLALLVRTILHYFFTNLLIIYCRFYLIMRSRIGNQREYLVNKKLTVVQMTP